MELFFVFYSRILGFTAILLIPLERWDIGLYDNANICLLTSFRRTFIQRGLKVAKNTNVPVYLLATNWQNGRYKGTWTLYCSLWIGASISANALYTVCVVKINRFLNEILELHFHQSYRSSMSFLLIRFTILFYFGGRIVHTVPNFHCNRNLK